MDTLHVFSCRVRHALTRVGHVNTLGHTLTMCRICGSLGNSSMSKRTWIGDSEDGSTYFPIDETHSSIVASANRSSPSVHNRIPHDIARLSPSRFVYTFRVTMGPKFVGLHFFPSDYLNFGHANSFFSVKAAGYTQLRNFSTLLFSNHTGFTSFCKEFSVVPDHSCGPLVPSPYMWWSRTTQYFLPS
ncbi:hypothetical protein ACJRO7_004376 [Eucalyptus globulus]|uniref:Uncharacterized protein n=1 Tax=Eucalyptus globulus TaxID=34317 RepID=A0ABD3IWR5_EUCGL